MEVKVTVFVGVDDNYDAGKIEEKIEELLEPIDGRVDLVEEI